MSLNLIRLAARAATRGNTRDYRWLNKQYKEHVFVTRHEIVHYERLFQALKIVPADFLLRNCHHTPCNEIPNWLREPYKIQTRRFAPLFSYCDSAHSFTITSLTVEHNVKRSIWYTEQEAHEWVMKYLLKLKIN